MECAKEKCPVLTKGLTLATPGACPDPAVQAVARRPNPLLAAVENGQLIAQRTLVNVFLFQLVKQFQTEVGCRQIVSAAGVREG